MSDLTFMSAVAVAVCSRCAIELLTCLGAQLERKAFQQAAAADEQRRARARLRPLEA